MSDTQPFGLIVLVTAAVVLLAVLAHRISARVRVPLPAFFLAAAAIAAAAVPQIHAPAHRTVERVVTVALVLILVDGGLNLGLRRFRQAAGPITLLGLVGTFLTVGAAAVIAHAAFGLDWYAAVLVATAVAPTDPAVVFSVLGQRQIAGRSSTVLEGESGANDPVGIALMSSLITAGALGVSAFAHVGGTFLAQMAIGAAVGIAGGQALHWCLRKVALPSEALYPLLSLAGVLLIFGVASVGYGSGFLAVFVAGILLGDVRAPYKPEIERFHGALASLGEIVAFVVLGLTIDLRELTHANVLIPGLILGVVLAVVIRPVVGALCLLPARLARNELAFVLFAGLKGAVPILLGSFLLTAHLADAPRLYGIVVVVVVFSVVVQGSLVPLATHVLRLPVLDPSQSDEGVDIPNIRRDLPDGPA